MLVASHGTFQPGDRVVLRFREDPSAVDPRVLHATVVRASVDDDADFWRHVLAVEIAGSGPASSGPRTSEPKT
jgi:hypothetical protein